MIDYKSYDTIQKEKNTNTNIKTNNKGDEILTAVITDGGVYDNLGLDPLLVPNAYLKVPVPVFHNNEEVKVKQNFIPHLFVLVSDGGRPVLEEDKPNYHMFTTSGLKTVGLMGDQVDRLRKRLLKESFKNYAMAGAVWSINDLLNYVYDVSEVVQKREEKLTGFAKPVEKTGGVVEANEALKVARETPIKVLEEQIDTIFNKLVKEKNFPSLENIFGIDISQPSNKEKCARARNVVKLLMTIRTDLDTFYPEEVNILIALGYTLCAYKMHIYCFRELNHLKTSNVIPTPVFTRNVKKMNLTYFENYLYMASSVLQAPIRCITFLGKKAFAKIFRPNYESL